MSLITITETGRFTDQPNATLSFDHGAPQPITITDPFSDAEEKRLTNRQHFFFLWMLDVRSKFHSG